MLVIGTGSFSRMAEATLSWLLPWKGSLAGEHFVENRTERKDVAAAIDFFPFNLFRRHVLKGADDSALLGDRRAGGRVGEW